MNSETLAGEPRSVLLLAFIIVLAAALRFYGLGTESLWLDEALSWQQASLPASDLLISIAADVHPPLYALLLHACISLFGDSEWALRLLSAVTGTASVWLIWAVARRITTDNTALIAALLCAISLFTVRYSQEARMYALMNCLALASMLTLLRISDDRTAGHPAYLERTAYLFATALLIYSHVYGLFVLVAQNIYMVARYLPGWRTRPAITIGTWVGLQALLALIFAPWLYVLIKQIGRVQTSFWINRPDWNSLVGTFESYMSVMPSLLLALIALAFGLFVLLRPASAGGDDNFRLGKNAASALLGAWLLTPILLPYLISQVAQPIYMPRYTIASSSAWFILVATGLSCMHPAWLRQGLLALLVVSMAGALPFYYANAGKTNWPEAVNFVERDANAGDLVLFHNPDVIVPYRYYAKRTDLDLRTVVAAETWQAAGVTDQRKPDIRPLVVEFRQVWLVSGYDVKTAITETEILDQLGDELSLAEGLEFSAIRVFRFIRQ